MNNFEHQNSKALDRSETIYCLYLLLSIFLQPLPISLSLSLSFFLSIFYAYVRSNVVMLKRKRRQKEITFSPFSFDARTFSSSRSATNNTNKNLTFALQNGLGYFSMFRQNWSLKTNLCCGVAIECTYT